ncbi:MAG TPA: amino acid adenylation domain-containing protein [Thermoanaerobaculia bacterium]|nr:amino acid adenylation domain-containing protein [Thermoanaerobaculia bacterium]
MTDTNDRLAGLSDAKRALLEKLVAERRAAAGQVRPRPRPERVPLSIGQERLWMVEQLAPGTTAYNVPIVLWLDGALNAEALDRALQELVRRHETLRSSVLSEGGKPFQKIAAEATVTIERADATSDAEAIGRARKAASTPFDLTRGPLLRGLLVRVTAERHLFVLVAHHLMIDGWSANILLGELSHLYNAFAEGKPSPLAPLAIQYADYAMWQREWLEGDRLQKQLDFWREHLEGCPSVLDIPADRARPPVQSFRGSMASHRIPEDLYEAMEAFARRENVTAFMVLFAAWTTLLHRWTGQSDLPVGVGLANRPKAELEALVGLFVNTLVVRTNLGGEPAFRDLLARVRETTLGMQANQDAPLTRVMENVKVERAASHMPLLQVMLFFQNYAANPVPMNGLTVSRVSLGEVPPGGAPTDIALYVNQNGRGELLFQYSTDLFDAETIARLAGNFIVLLRAAIDAPETEIGRLPMLTAEERAQLERWNDTRLEYASDRPLIDLLHAQMAKTPDAVAVTLNGRTMTYDELRLRASALAQELRANGVGPGSLVGLYVDRSLEMLIGLAGVLEAGGAYVPLDPSYPADRLAYMLEMAEARVVVTQRELREAVDEILPSAGRQNAGGPADGNVGAPVRAAVVLVDSTVPVPVILSRSDVATGREHGGEGPPSEAQASPSDLAYVIFTSGSTGKPKGVEITQRNAANLLASVAREPGMQAGDTICAVSTLSFDIALFELVLPLTVGAHILLADRDTARDGAALARLVDTSDVTVMQATPATWRMLLDIGWRGKPGLKMITTGEACPRELADRLLPICRELWNLYGPTETTVYSALGPIEAGTGPISIGRPVANTQIHIVDRNFQQLPVGVPGELLIGGDGVGRGYRGRPDLTSEKFIADPFSSVPGARVYRAGDLAIWRRDGTLEVLGRMDHQVKLRGFRIELGEIEAALAEYEGVEQAVVHCREDRPGDKRLVAYVSAAGATAPAVDAMRAHLRQSLPDYMIPSAFMVLEAFPLTPNGKVDRKALPAPEAAEAGAGFEAPANPDEVQMAGLWSEVLGRMQIGRNDNFFDLGGHSLLATQLLSRLQGAFGVELPLRVLFDSPTVASLAAHVAEARAANLEGENLEDLLAQLENLSDEEALALRASGSDHA